MADQLQLATRKGLFLLARRGGRFRVERVPFLGDPVTALLEDRRDGALYAALNLGHFGVKLHRSDDGGRSFVEVRAPSFAALEGGQGPSVAQIWTLAEGGVDEPGVLWAGTIPAALFRSADRGESWSLVRSLWERPERRSWFGGGYPEPGVHSICVDPRDPRTLLLAISCGGVWFTSDAAASFECRSRGMYAEYMPPERREDPNIQDPHRLVQSPTHPDVLWVQHHNGVFRSTDLAQRWTEVDAIRPSKFGFAVAVHPRDPATAWFVPAARDERRVPVDGCLRVARTRDGGRSFETFGQGLPEEHAYDLVYRHGLSVDPAGEELAMGSTTGHLWASSDGGERWTLEAGHLPPIYQVAFRLAPR